MAIFIPLNSTSNKKFPCNTWKKEDAPLLGPLPHEVQVINEVSSWRTLVAYQYNRCSSFLSWFYYSTVFTMFPSLQRAQPPVGK